MKLFSIGFFFFCFNFSVFAHEAPSLSPEAHRQQHIQEFYQSNPILENPIQKKEPLYWLPLEQPIPIPEIKK